MSAVAILRVVDDECSVTMADSASFSIRLSGTPSFPAKKGRGSKPKATPPPPQQKRHVFTVTPALTLGELRFEAKALFGARSDCKVKLLSGFPPKALDAPDAMLAKDCLGKMENVIVCFETEQATGLGNSGAGSSTATTPAASGGRKRPRPAPSDAVDAPPPAPGRRPRRAAAEAATSSFAEVIKAQEAQMKAERKAAATSAKRRKPKAASSSSDAAARASAAASRRMQALGGYRLSDGASVPPSRVIPRSSESSGGRGVVAKSATGLTMRSEDDVSYKLLSSLEGGGARGKVGGFLRAAMRGAVGKSYERSKAVVRVNAVRSGRYTMACKVGSGGRLGGNNDGDSAHVGFYTVIYSKGVEGRGEYEDDVEIIGLEALKAVIRSVYSDTSEDDDIDTKGGVCGPREMLRPENMAQLSPRVFWSLARHFSGSDIENALQTCLPDLDWSYLGGRTRILSQKARENQRQERVEKGEIQDESTSDSKGDYDAAVGVVGAVEEAMQKMHENDHETAREKASRAAAARLQGVSGARKSESVKKEELSQDEVWRIVTPNEVDEDELRECIQEGLSSNAGLSVKVSDDTVQKWISTLIEHCSVRNWRELANAEAKAVRTVVLNDTANINSHVVTEEIIDAWIDAAQSRTVEEIVIEIVGGDEDALVALREEASAGTPKDLACWAAVPGMLLEATPSLSGKKGEDKEITVQDISRWCMRSKAAIDQLDWLEWYATPVK